MEGNGSTIAGEEFLPQTEVLPKAVLPIFWDQHDNAQRIEETSR